MRCTIAFAAALLLAPQAAAPAPLLDRLLIIAPAAPGGGWDQTARAMQHALEREGIVRIVEVQNVAGAAGTIGLAQFVDAHRGRGAALLITGLVMLGATVWNDSPVSLGQVTPIARLTGEHEVIAVAASSPHRGMASIVAELRRAPGLVSWAGGSAGGTDHILAALIGAAAGVDPRRVNYIAFSGGGEALAALLGGNVTAGVSGYSEFGPHIESGLLRALAVSSASRIPGIDVPTLAEQGLDVTLANWRGIVAPPAVPEAERRLLGSVIAAMVRSGTWRKTLAERGWTDTFLAAEEFSRYLDSERGRVTRIVRRLRGPAGLAEPIRAGQRIFPIAIFTGSAIVLVLLLRRGRAVHGKSDRANLRALGIASSGLVAFLVLLEPLGFIVAGSMMFAGVAHALRPRWTSAVAGGVFTAAVYLAFTRGLDLALPSGSAWTWIR